MAIDIYFNLMVMSMKVPLTIFHINAGLCSIFPGYWPYTIHIFWYYFINELSYPIEHCLSIAKIWWRWRMVPQRRPRLNPLYNDHFYEGHLGRGDQKSGDPVRKGMKQREEGRPSWRPNKIMIIDPHETRYFSSFFWRKHIFICFGFLFFKNLFEVTSL